MVLYQVLLLGRLHHRNLVNLVGYCVDKGQHMLIYEFMSSGSLENLLYGNLRNSVYLKIISFLKLPCQSLIIFCYLGFELFISDYASFH